jgi:flagellar motor component MotA
VNITLGQISAFLGLIAGLIASVSAIILFLQKSLKKVIKNELEPMSIQIEKINSNVNGLDVSQCKNFLVRFLADVEQGNKLDEVEKERAYEIYDHYTNDLKQNSYIHKRWEELVERK